MEIKQTETYLEHDITVDGKTIGTVELCPERNEISRLVIFEPYQNKGYGTATIKELASQGYTSLWVRSDNPRAIHVYEKCGFKRVKTQMFEMRFEPQAESSDQTNSEDKKAETCEDAVSRQAVLDALDKNKYSDEFCEEHNIDWSINLGMAHMAVNELEPVNSSL